MNLGEPQHYAYCMRCQRTVGGPYFDSMHAIARRKEHRVNYHGDSAKSWEPKRPSHRTAKRDLFDVVMR